MLAKRVWTWLFELPISWGFESGNWLGSGWERDSRVTPWFVVLVA